MIKYIFALIVVSLILSSISIAWPKFSSRQRPQILESTYNIVKNTQFGIKTAQVLGVTDASISSTIDLGTFTRTQVASAGSVIEKKIQSIIVTQAMIHLLNQYNSLSSGQKQQIRDLICLPPNR